MEEYAGTPALDAGLLARLRPSSLRISRYGTLKAWALKSQSASREAARPDPGRREKTDESLTKLADTAVHYRLRHRETAGGALILCNRFACGPGWPHPKPRHRPPLPQPHRRAPPIRPGFSAGLEFDVTGEGNADAGKPERVPCGRSPPRFRGPPRGRSREETPRKNARQGSVLRGEQIFAQPAPA